MEEFVQQLNVLLKKKNDLDSEIANLINMQYDGKVRVSAKKMVADLGEYYVLKSLSFINNLEQLRAPNADCDLVGEVSEELREKWMLKNRRVRIEVNDQVCTGWRQSISECKNRQILFTCFRVS